MADPVTVTCAYVHFYTMLVPVAKEHGYALALHGTVQRDLDMIAVPWVEKPSTHHELLEAFCDALGIKKTSRVPDHHRGEKLHGRVAYNIPVMDGGWIDVSIMPVEVAGSVQVSGRAERTQSGIKLPRPMLRPAGPPKTGGRHDEEK